jgi:hypothetical protein
MCRLNIQLFLFIFSTMKHFLFLLTYNLSSKPLWLPLVIPFAIKAFVANTKETKYVHVYEELASCEYLLQMAVHQTSKSTLCLLRLFEGDWKEFYFRSGVCAPSGSNRTATNPIIWCLQHRGLITISSFIYVYNTLSRRVVILIMRHRASLFTVLLY